MEQRSSKIFQTLGPICHMKGFDDLSQVAAEDGRQSMQGQSNAVVCDPSLREVVRADFGASVSSADL